MSNWDNSPARYPYDAGPDDDDTWFHPVTYDQTVYPDAEPDPALDDYAGYDDVQSGLARQAEAAWQEQQHPDGAWAPRLRRGPRRRIAAAGRPPWRIVGVTALAAALGFGVVIVTGRVNHSLPSSALPGGTVVPGTAPQQRPAPRRPALPPRRR